MAANKEKLVDCDETLLDIDFSGVLLIFQVFYIHTQSIDQNGNLFTNNCKAKEELEFCSCTYNATLFH